MTDLASSEMNPGFDPFLLAGYVTDGYLSPELAHSLARRDLDERQNIASQLAELGEAQLTEGESTRLEWLSGQLTHEIIDKTVFVETVSSKPVRQHRAGLGFRSLPGTGGSTNGRHSSGYVPSAF
jgi:hypothetical protein